MESLDDDTRSQVQALRKIILGTMPSLREHIKWNAPSYALNGEDRITFNTINKENLVKLVIHMGTTHKEDKSRTPVLQEDGGIVQWISDIRGVVTFESYKDVKAKSTPLKDLLTRWLATSH